MTKSTNDSVSISMKEEPITIRAAMPLDSPPSTENPKGLADMYKIQLRDLIALQVLSAWETSNAYSYIPSEDGVRNAYKVADLFLKVRLEPVK